MKADLQERTPAEIETHIEQTRASLDRKLSALEHRFSPREQLQRVRARMMHDVDGDSVVGWAAVGAVAAGTLLALNGWRRYHNGRNGHADEYADLADLEEVVMLDCAELPPEL